MSVRARREAGFVIITITDDGPGIPEEHLKEVLLRGGRLDRSGGGAGLGLAIVGDVADVWGGRFNIRTKADGLEAEFAVPFS